MANQDLLKRVKDELIALFLMENSSENVFVRIQENCTASKNTLRAIKNGKYDPSKEMLECIAKQLGIL